MVQSLAQLIGPPISGSLIGGGDSASQLANYSHLLAFGGLCLVIATIFTVLARYKLEKRLFAVC